MNELTPIEPLFTADETRRNAALQMAMDIHRGSTDMDSIMKTAKAIEGYLKGTVVNTANA